MSKERRILIQLHEQIRLTQWTLPINVTLTNTISNFLLAKFANQLYLPSYGTSLQNMGNHALGNEGNKGIGRVLLRLDG